MTPVIVVIIGVIAITMFAYELRSIETRLTNLDSKIVNVDEKIDRRSEAVEQHLTETDKRLAETNERLGRALDQQADMAAKINKIDADLTFIHKRIDLLDQPKTRRPNLPR
jgi:chromosome segregation ATPase